MRRALLKLHLVLALLAGAFLLVLGVTGSIMAFEPELDHLLHARRSYVRPHGSPLALTALADVASAALPGQRVTGYVLSASPDLSYQVLMGRRAVYVDQYTGQVLDIREPVPDLLSRVHQLHLRLLIQNRSDTGKAIITLTGAVLLVLLATGLYLWWPSKRMVIDLRATGRRRWFDVHTTLGIASFVFLLIVTVTGLVIGLDDRLAPLIYRVTRSAPALMYAPPKRFIVKPSGAPIGADGAVEVARATLPGAAPISVNVPPPNGTYVISARYPEDRTPGGRSRLVVDQYTGHVLAVESSRTAPAGSRLVTLNRAIHTGDLFGIPSKSIMSLASLAVVAQLVSGLALWMTARSAAARR